MRRAGVGEREQLPPRAIALDPLMGSQHPPGKIAGVGCFGEAHGEQLARPHPPRPGREDGFLGKLGAGPEAVAKAIQSALSASRPRPRYRVTPSARLMLTQRKLMPDRAWDAMVGTSFPRPGS